MSTIPEELPKTITRFSSPAMERHESSARNVTFETHDRARTLARDDLSSTNRPGGCDWNWVKVKTDFAAKRLRPLGPWMRVFIKERRLFAAGEKSLPLPAAKSRRSLMRGTQNRGNARFVFVRPHPVSITLHPGGLRLLALVLLGLLPIVAPAQEPDGLRQLLAVYATQPRDYPTGKDCASPDLSVPFRWHSFHDGAIGRFEDAKMLAHVEPFNPLDDAGVLADKASKVTWKFVAGHATAGKDSLQVTFPAAAITAGKAVVRVQGIAGDKFFSAYLRGHNAMGPACVYGPHFRWIKLDVFNPAKGEVGIRLCGVPMILHRGANVVAVKTADAVDRHYRCAFNTLPFEVTRGEGDVTLFIDNARMEQETPAVIGQKGRMFQFAGRAEAKDSPVLAPGFTAVGVDSMYSPQQGWGWTQPATTRAFGGHSFRSFESGIFWGCCRRVDSPFRIDLPEGRHGIYLLAVPVGGHSWAKGASVKVNGQDQMLVEPKTDAEVRRMALGGGTWDYRPGTSVWESLVRPSFYPPTRLLTGSVTNGQLLLEIPPTVAVHALMIFPEADRAEALKELGRFNYLLAESWDVSHPWVKPAYARRANDGHPYIGVHDEMIHSEKIPQRLAALKLTASDFQRGFVTYQRGLTEAIYPDTIPTPEEVAARELRAFAAPGQFECVTLGLLPLQETRDLRIEVSDLAARGGGASIPASRIDVRVSRQHQKVMQFGHHNHDYNYQEHYLIVRPMLDLHPGAARRIYFDISVAPDARPGEYTGAARVLDASGKALATVPLVLEVLPIDLQKPPVWFACNIAHPRLKEYGFNTLNTSYDDAVKNGYAGFIASMTASGVRFKDKAITWSNFAASKDLLAPILQAGRDGTGPRGFFGGIAPDTYSNPKAAEVSARFFGGILHDFPQLDVLGRTVPAYYFRENRTLFQFPHEWGVLSGPPIKDDPALMDADRKAGKPFWYIDGMRHSKEQAARFTFGLWLWRSGAAGRFTTLAAVLQYGGGTARESYPIEPYYTLLDVTTCNVDRALKESLVEGILNPCRDLILLRAGIDDYRYIHTLEAWLQRTEARKPASPALPAARKFRDDLWASLSPDLTQSFRGRSGAYGETLYPAPDFPWTPDRFARIRRQAADHIVALRKAMGE